MPVFNQVEGGRRFANIAHGKIIEYQKDDVNLEYTHMSGRLVNITFKQTEQFGEKLCLHLLDEEDYWILETFSNSRYATSFLMQMENIDLLKDITIIPSMKEKDGKKEYSLFLNQDGKALKWFYSKNSEQKAPDLVPCKMRNPNGPGMVDSWDNTLRMEFLKNKVFSVVVPNLQRLPNPYPNHPGYRGNAGPGIAGNYFGKEETRVHTPQSDRMNNDINHEDDLPF